MALFDNPGANTMILTGLGLMGPNPFAGAQRGLMQGAQLGAQAAAEKRAEAQAQRQQTEFERIQAERKAQEAFLMGGGISGAPGPQFASAGTQPAPGAPINLLPVGGAGGASIPARNTMLAGLGVNQQQAANLARMGSGAWPIIQMMQAQRERQAKLNAPQKRRIVKGADGYNYYADTGERVIPGIERRDPDLLSPEAQAQAIERRAAGRTNVTQTVDQGGGPQLTPAQKKVDELYAQEYNDFVTSGGYADTDRNLAQVENVLQRLEAPGDVGGTFAARFLPESMRAVVDAEGLDIQQTIEQVVQRDLRQVLGGQFAALEGEQLIARAYNPRLSDEANIKRVRRLYKAMREGAEAQKRAAEYYEENGTLQGFRGSRGFSKSRLFNALDEDTPEETATSDDAWEDVP